MPTRRFSLLRFGWRLLVLALLAGGWALAAAALHVVVVPQSADSAEDGFRVLLLPKNRMSFRDSYADTRTWSAQDIAAHEALVARLIEAGHADRLGHVLSPELRKRLEEMLRVRRSTVMSN